jgi:ABC-type transport system involved in multi-copper enzyme maturation permease subunit
MNHGGAVLWALIVDSFRESLSRKIFWGFAGCSTAVILFFLVVLNIDMVEGSLASIKLFGLPVNEGQTIPAEDVVGGMLGTIAAFLFSIGLFLAIFAAAGLVPTVLEAGRIELLLSKPISRLELLLGKFAGAVAVIGVNLIYLAAGVWLVLGLKTGIWKPMFLFSALLALLAFAVMLSIVQFVAVLTNSAVLATMVAYFVLLLGAVASAYDTIGPLFASSGTRYLMRTVYYMLPKVFEMGGMARLAMAGGPIESWMPVWSSLLFGGVMLAASYWVFDHKDY